MAENGDVTNFTPTAKTEGTWVILFLSSLVLYFPTRRSTGNTKTPDSAGKSLFASAVRYLGISPAGACQRHCVGGFYCAILLLHKRTSAKRPPRSRVQFPERPWPVNAVAGAAFSGPWFLIKIRSAIRVPTYLSRHMLNFAKLTGPVLSLPLRARILFSFTLKAHI